ncbi:hypothetical protein C3L33_08010, partial [Rhododendron williamsianum]
MLTGRSDVLPELGSSKNRLHSGSVSELSDDEEAGASDQILYTASFKELAAKNVQYETIIWVSISLLLVLAWGVGIIMLLYLPIKRYVLQKDISSRKLYVTPHAIVYKVIYLILLLLLTHYLGKVIDVIIEQGCLQSVYGIHTFRVESIAYGKAAPVDELQIIVTEASKVIQEVGRSWRPASQIAEGETMVRVGSLEGPAVFRSPSKSWKIVGSPRHASVEQRGGPLHADLLLHKLDEVNKSVKKIESLIDKFQSSEERSSSSRVSPVKRLEF